MRDVDGLDAEVRLEAARRELVRVERTALQLVKGGMMVPLELRGDLERAARAFARADAAWARSRRRAAWRRGLRGLVQRSLW